MTRSYPIEETAALQARFCNAWLNLDTLAAPPFDDVVVRYTEPHRSYHTLQHISEGYRWLDASRHLADYPFEVELALIYHDIVYEPWRSDNERRSAELFRVHAQTVCLASEPTDRICTSIEATATHCARFGDAALLGDIDLWVLGAPPERYTEYEQQVRQEYGYVAEELFHAGREKVLRRFLTPKTIFITAFFRQRLELWAQWNLRRTLTHLEQSRYGHRRQ